MANGNGDDRISEIAAIVMTAVLSAWRWCGSGRRERRTTQIATLAALDAIKADLGGIRSEMRETRREVEGIREDMRDHERRDESFQNWTRGKLANGGGV